MLILDYSIGILQTRNELNQNLLHLSAIYGAKECMRYLINFHLLNSNEQDVNGNLPLYYLVKNHTDDNKDNKEMFLWLATNTNVSTNCSDGVPIKDLFNDWQKYIHSKYIQNAIIQTYNITEN
jgi:hypothetical protein